MGFRGATEVGFRRGLLLKEVRMGRRQNGKRSPGVELS